MGLLTRYVLVDDLWYLVEHEALQVKLPQPLLQGPGAVRYGMDYLGEKGLVGRDLAVPTLHKLPQDDGEKGIQLQVDVVAARQRRQELVNGRLHIAALVSRLLGAEDPPNEDLRCAVG